MNLKSDDVIHSFFLPSMRIKQDAMPGLTIPVLFDVDDAGSYELVCAELCGWGHTRMGGVVTVHDTQAEFDAWFTEALGEQGRSQLAPTSGRRNRRARQKRMSHDSRWDSVPKRRWMEYHRFRAMGRAPCWCSQLCDAIHFLN